MSLQYTIPDLIQFAGSQITHPAVKDALERALGASSERGYQVAMREATQAISGYTGIDLTQSSGGAYMPNDYFKGSLPIYMPVMLQRFGDIQDDLLLDHAIVDARLVKNVVRTAVQGKDGTVKEYISASDWEVEIRGLVAQREFGYPKDQVDLLRQYIVPGESIGVINTALNALKIYELVILEVNLPHTPHLNCARYEISAVSNDPYELTLKSNNP